MEFKPTDYLKLPVDLRLHLLGLPAARRRGRPRALGFLERVRVAQAHAEALNAHAIHVRDRGRDRAIAKLQAKFRGLCAANAAPHKLAEITAAIDKVGRVTRVPIKPPDKLLPDIDKQVAELFGITERMVRRCRTDPKLQQFMPHPVWLERDWLKQERLIFEARQVAKRLMTPERYAKQEPIGLVNGSIKVFDTIDLLPISGSGRHALWTFRSSAQNAGIPFKTGTEIEVIPGAGPRHRVGCEDFSIGGPPIRNVVHRIDRLGSWRALRDQWRSHRADYRRDRCTHSEFWSAAEQAWPRWEAVDPKEMPWGIQAKTVDDVVLLVEKVFTPLAGRYYRIEFLRDLIAAYLEAGGTVTCCPTFAHDLPMGWTTKAIREPARVLGPHQTWLYMHHAPLRQTAERYARTEEALATWEFNYRRWAYRGLPSETLLVLRAVACENMPIDWTDDLEKVRSALKVISVKNAPIRPNMV